jgi:SAM-dependent methyltransferase
MSTVRSAVTEAKTLARRLAHPPLRLLRSLSGLPPFELRVECAGADFYDASKPLRGWISSSRAVRHVELRGAGGADTGVRLEPRPDVERAMGGRYRRHTGFLSGRSIAEIAGSRGGEIEVSFALTNGTVHTARVSMAPLRERKLAKRQTLVPLLACPSCQGSLEPGADAVRCPRCAAAYPVTANSVNFLTAEFQKQFSIVPTENVSAWDYDPRIVEIIRKHPDRMFLDCGAGYRTRHFDNVINFEIVDYPSTDVLGVGEKLPFAANSLDGVFSVAVLEHVKDPFLCAREIVRVLKPGGVLFCAVPFLQPLHAYPHHYYNMTKQGLANLFEALDIREQYVPLSLHPMTSLQWILRLYAQGLPPTLRRVFLTMPVGLFLKLGGFQTWPNRRIPVIHDLRNDAWTELAGGNVIVAYKR